MPSPRDTTTDARRRLVRIKLLHTAAWAFFVASILGVWVGAWDARFDLFLVCAGVVMVEVLVLAFNGMQCPLTPIAARYTTDRRPNFDIYLPEWVARHNKTIFGSLFVLGLAYGALRWDRRVGPPAAPTEVQALLDSYAPDLRIGGRVSSKARTRYRLQGLPYTGYRDSTYHTVDGLHELTIRVDAFVDDREAKVPPYARIESVWLRIRDSASIANVMRRVGTVLGPPEVRCRYSSGYGLTREHFWPDSIGLTVWLGVRLPSSADTVPPAWDALPVGTGSVVFGARRYGGSNWVDCP
jgi:hypothetical protein